MQATAPLPRVCAVELPGRVANPAEAVASIGGAAAVRQAMMHRDGRLRLRLCRKYQFQAPLPMRRRRTSDVLVKATRRSDGSWDCQPVGVVDTSFGAEVLADFLYVPGASLSHGQSPVVSSIEQELCGERVAGAPYMPPAFFTRVDTAQAYDFEENAFLRRQKSKEVKSVAGTGETKLRRAWISVSVVKFREKGPAPTSPPEGAEAQLREDERKVAEAVRTLFVERPLWLRGPLEERLREQSFSPNVTTMQKSLLCVAYLWSDGPWRGAYARLGFDPRLAAEESCRLQVIDFRDRFLRQQRSYFERIQGVLDAGSVQVLDCHFRTPPVNRSQLYQLGDIEDEVVQQTLSALSGFGAEASEKFGWMPQPALETIRERMAVKAELMRRSRLANVLALEAPTALQALPASAPETQPQAAAPATSEEEGCMANKRRRKVGKSKEDVQ
ncbi:unnamed protein product [Polarella glacialis]|uniref:Transcription factor IIIC subunit 5 HTH domain-containing protein n=1 Tax=Polarella glacialis TaxID=89957 RepID=A0A813E7S2_POLGL|nr:unnamed protein product [Polarella glacialis]CAE8679105.1 unnamed protein product [Polarella glacialis]|mmetsp:Transcript_22447/g.40048  ORF Transcript_22447/g.40048 Transcript_22447/m.40048 type:complete len:443 (+) Transcript_22447:140-1468(+)